MTNIPATRWASYGKRFFQDKPCPAILCKSDDSAEGRLSIWDKDMVPTGYTGVIWKISAPTGWSGDRYNKEYIVQPTTGMLSLTGETGPKGSYDIFWRTDMGGVTGCEHGQWYGLQIGMNTAGVTGCHHTADLAIKISDSFK